MDIRKQEALKSLLASYPVMIKEALSKQEIAPSPVKDTRAPGPKEYNISLMQALINAYNQAGQDALQTVSDFAGRELTSPL